MHLTKEDYFNLVLESRLLFRYGISELMEISEKLKLPFFIVSGGISEIIEAHFITVMNNGEIDNDNAKSCWDSAKIFSNAFHYHDEGFTIDFKRPIIHVLNKQQFIYETNTDFKRNVIVMGDILEDIAMVK